jgi:hypothetical protein
MVRPCKLDTTKFQRHLSDADRAILLTAGQGDLSQGFHTLLHVYSALHNAGYRPEIDISEWLLFKNTK